MLSVLRTHLPSDIPIAGCELTPYVLLRKPDNSITTDDIPEGAPVQGYYLQCKWLRVKNEKRVAVCSVHPSEVATLQCLLCVKAKLPAAKSYHCSPQCFAAAWRNHKELHARAAAAPAKDQNGNNTAPEEEELFGTGPPGSSHATRRSIIGLPNGAAYPAPAPREQRGEGGESWYEVGQGKSYTPSSDDVGHILKLECTPMDAKTRQPVAAPSTLLTSRVIPAPSPTPRRMVSIFGEGTSEIGERLIKPGTFTVVSYNVLADLYATNEMYSYCPPWALSWAYRKQNLLKELVGYRADILCLQEVQSDHYEEFFAPELKKHGYAAVYKKKTGEVSQVYTGSSYAIDGCATFFKESRFSLVKKYEVEFNKAALSLSEALGPAASKKAALNRLLKDNVALIVVLEAKEHEGADGPLPGQSKRQLLCVANTHIHANPELKDVKLWQVHTLLKGLEKIAASADIPMLVAGDFNSVPGSCPHSLLATGRVDPAHPELATDPLGILRPATKLQHQLPLVSAYGAFARVPGPNGEALRRKIDPATQEPLFTNCTRDFLGTLDYIFYTADSLQPEALLELLNEEDLRKDTGLPSPEWSSDHIALLAEFRYKPRQRR